LPQRNEADVEEIPEDVRNELEIVFALHISDALNAALVTEATDALVLPTNLEGLHQRAGKNINEEQLIAKKK
jgi:hypothetical protein